MIQVKFNDKAKQVLADTLDLSGSVVVTELPEVGEEHTIYELRETKVLQSLVTMYNQQMREDHVLGDINDCLVFNTTEEMQNTFNSITPEEDYIGEIYLNYITEEDKLVGATYVKGAWRFIEATKVSDCKFSVGAIFELEDDEYEVILKEYLGEVQGEIGYHATLFNGEPYVFEQKTTGILLGTPTICRMIRCNCTDEFPELPEDAPSEYVFETIPYEKIINYQLLPHNIWYFTPKGREVTEISYWIYTNNEWVNIEEIGKLNTITLPVKSFDADAGLIPLSKVHFYLDNMELDLVIVPSLTPDEEDDGYLVVPLLDNAGDTYSLHIIFDNDVVFGGDCNFYNGPFFVTVEDGPHIRLTNGTTEYDFNIYIGDLSLINGNTK